MRRILLAFVLVLWTSSLALAGFYFGSFGKSAEEQDPQVHVDPPQVHVDPPQFIEPPFQLSQEMKDYVEWRRLENLRYKGTKMIPSRSAPPDQLALQEEISAAFNAQDPQPPVRAKQFAPWLTHATYKVVLWRGEITKLEVSPDGSATVTVVIAIMISKPEGRTSTFTFDHAIETWQYKDGTLTFVESEGHVTGKWAMIG